MCQVKAEDEARLKVGDETLEVAAVRTHGRPQDKGYADHDELLVRTQVQIHLGGLSEIMRIKSHELMILNYYPAWNL